MRLDEDELEKFINSVDLDKNGVSDKKQISTFFKDIWSWLKVKKNLALVVLSVALTICLFWMTMHQKEVKQVVSSNIQKVKDITSHAKDSTKITIDLTKAEVTKVFLRDIVDSDGEKEGEDFRVYYRLKGENGNTYWLTIKELMLKDKNQLFYNKAEFEKYVEKETKNAEMLSK